MTPIASSIPRPNILWICTDQQRFDTIACLGNPHLRTPHLDRLAASGMAFLRCYSQSPICTPSRASFLTGCYPSAIHVQRNGNECYPGKPPLVTKLLADAGYDCGLAGKLHIAGAYGRVEPRTDDGYRLFRWSHHPYDEEFWPHSAHAYQQWLDDRGVVWRDAYSRERDIEACHHQTTWCAEEAIDFLSQPREGPWLMSVNPFDPHPPMDPPAEYMERMDIESMPLPLFCTDELQSQLAFADIAHQTRQPLAPDSYDARRNTAAYYAMIELIDDQVGRMIDALEETGQRENTIVIFTSDHGEMLGDHGLIHKGCRFYEGAVHVPLIISCPGRFTAGVRSRALVELTDLAPTLLEASGLPIPQWMQGLSLVPILAGDADPDLHRDFVRCEYHDALDLPASTHANMLFDGRFKLAVYHGHDIGELYDLEQDPEEFENRWFDRECAEIRHDLVKRLFDAIMLTTDLGTPRVGRF